MTGTPDGRQAAALALSIDPGCRIESGAGCLTRLPDLVAGLGAHRAFVVSDRGLRAAIGAVREVSGAIDVKRLLRELRADRDMLPPIAAGAVADAGHRQCPALSQRGRGAQDPRIGLPIRRGNDPHGWH
jgi:alcohol dehydrogenase